jgi:drug/metabolite transporter (DMT)-like permease
MPRSTTAAAIPLVFVLTLLWGTNWALFPYAVQEVSVWTFRAVSLVVSGLILLALAKLRGQSLAVPRRDWGVLVAAALVYLVVWNVASTYAAILIPSGQAAILGFTMPVWATLVGWALFREKPSPRLLLAVALSAVGVGLLAYAARGAYAKAPLGFFLGLLAGLFWALGTIILKRAQLKLPPLVLTGWQLLIAAVPIVAAAFALGTGEWFMPSWTSIAVIAYIAVVPMALGNAAWFSIVGLLPASVSGLSSVMVPMVAMVTGAIVHREPLGAYQLAAMACCAGAMVLALYKPSPAPKQA